MIVASLPNLAALEDIPPSVREAARLLTLALPAGLREGRSKLGDFDIIVSTAPSKPASEQAFEAHRKNIDLHLVLAGSEGYRAAALGACAADRPYDPATDAELFAPAASKEHVIVLAEGDVAVFFPEDAHKPRCRLAAAGDQATRKAVVKIPLEASRR
jgi:biofilm protein TabA